VRTGSLARTAWPLLVLAMVVPWVAWTPPLRVAVLHLVPVAFALFFVASFTGIGIFAVRWVLPEAARTDRILISAVLGAGLSGLLTFLPGVMGFVSPALYAVWTLLGAGLFLLAMPGFRIGASPSPDRPKAQIVTAAALLLISVMVLQLVPLLVAPVVSTDAMEYHLMIPKLALIAGRIGPLPSLMESGYPSLASWIYLLVMPLAGDITCKAIHFWAGVGLLLAIGRLVARIAPRSSRFLAPALYMTMPVAVGLFAVAWNDNLFVLCCLLALGQMLDFHQAPDGTASLRHLVMAGILLGLAAWTKYTIVMVLLALAPLLIVAVLRWGWRPVHLAVLAAPVALISLLVFVKNYLFTGNPFYPFLHDLFPSPFWDDTSAAYFHHALRNWEIPRWHWHTWLTFPYHMVFRPRLIDIHTGVLPLAAAPFLLFRSKNAAQTFLKGFLLANLLTWYLIRTETRSMLLFFCVLFVVAAPEMEERIFGSPVVRRAALVAVGVAAMASLLVTSFNDLVVTRPVRCFFGVENREGFLRREVRGYRALEWVNANPAVRGVVLVGMKRPYYAAKPAWFSAFADRPIAQVLVGKENDPAAVAHDLLARGISHILVDPEEYRKDHEEGLYSWENGQRRAFEELLKRCCREVAKLGGITIFEIRPSGCADTATVDDRLLLEPRADAGHGP